MSQISERVVKQLFPILQGLQMTLPVERYETAYSAMCNCDPNRKLDYPDNFCLAQISNFNKLIAISNEKSIPIFEITLDEELVQEGQRRTLSWFKFLYKALAIRVLELTSHE